MVAVPEAPAYLRRASSDQAMQDFAFGLGHFLEWTFTFITALGWAPVYMISGLLFVGLVYWLNQQGRYNRKAKADNTLA